MIKRCFAQFAKFMLTKKVRKYVLTPSLGLTPFLVYFILLRITSEIDFSLVISMSYAVVAAIFLSFWSKTKIGVVFLGTFIPLFLTFLFWVFFNNKIQIERIYYALPEILLILMIILMRMSKVFLTFHFFRHDNLNLKVFINQFFEGAVIIQYVFTFHVFVMLIYRQLVDNEVVTRQYDFIIYFVIPIFSILSLMIYEYVKTFRIIHKLNREEWLPIVNDKGEVKGKIAKSISLKMKNKFMHPVVRVALVCKGKVYLQPRKHDDVLDPDTFDYPFEKFMLFSHEINLAVRNSIVNTLGKELPFNFLLKYTFENEETKRLIFLFVSRLKDELEIEEISERLNGKFWTSKQIEEDFGDSSKFSECFQLEYEYLKNTILLADQIENNIIHTSN